LIAQYERKENLHLIDKEQRAILNDYCERKKFFNHFVDKLVIVDPLDRIRDNDKYPAMNNQ
jgi:hypothetical protein